MYLKLKELPSSELPRERLVALGPSALSNSELLAILLRTGAKNLNVIDLSNKILSDFDFEYLSNITVEQMETVHGMGPAKACQVVACFELGKRFSRYKKNSTNKIENSQDVYKLLGLEYGYKKKEHLIVIFLNKRNKIIKKENIIVGTLDTTLIHPREIFKSAINYSSSSIILVHNHPSGNPSPSPEDIEITKQIIQSGKILDINVLDHVIIGHNDYYSIRENNKELFDN